MTNIMIIRASHVLSVRILLHFLRLPFSSPSQSEEPGEHSAHPSTRATGSYDDGSHVSKARAWPSGCPGQPALSGYRPGSDEKGGQASVREGKCYHCFVVAKIATRPSPPFLRASLSLSLSLPCSTPFSPLLSLILPSLSSPSPSPSPGRESSFLLREPTRLAVRAGSVYPWNVRDVWPLYHEYVRA